MVLKLRSLTSFIAFMLVLLPQSAPAQDILCTEGGARCRSQLMRLDVANETLNQALASTQQLEDLALPAIDTFLQSEVFAESFITDYPMESMGFPFNSERCLSEQSEGDPNFLGLDCANPLLCSDASVNEAAKKEICLIVPCALLMGNQMSQCSPKSEARPTMVHFPQPVSLKKLAMNPSSISAEGRKLKVCFNVTQMEVSTAIEMEFQRTPQLTYPNLGMRDLKINLDGPRQICMSATIDMSAANPVSAIKIENVGGDFVSNVMVDRALAQAQVYGLDGYSATTVGILQTSALPPIVRHLRPTVEAAVRESMATVFEEQIGAMINSLKQGSNPSTMATPGDSFISELGVGNIGVSNYVDLMDCAIKKQNGTPIPADHECLNQIYPFRDNNLRIQDIPKPSKAAQYLREKMGLYDHVTSEKLRQKLLAFEGSMATPAMAELYRAQIKPLADVISINQLSSNLLNNVELMTSLGGRVNSSFGVSLPEICDLNNPSPHADRSIPNCPVQAYVDLNEMNRLLTSMYQTGRLCHRGRGDFVPQLTANGQQRFASNGAPLGEGCKFLVEGEQDGMSCFLNGAPQMRFDPVSQAYKLQMNTKACFRDAVIFGQGKIGGDINFDLSFNPSVCDGTDFCLQDGRAQWNVVEGSARFALRDESWLNGIVRNTIDKKLNELIGETLRLPLFSHDGPLSMVPMEADGRIDKGPGYFGACFKLKD